ncbi:hypothetical protein R1sor_000502 [Riccia sorocarpa]|uniref:Phosphatidylinositol-specific phospholipase C X domain-containing protein n=1 Tax=Riccia sorocarpa TaxID=122646 RepID=A0ABD3GWI0_9MARC
MLIICIKDPDSCRAESDPFNWVQPAMGNQIAKEREVNAEIKKLQELQELSGTEFPGSDYKPSTPNKEWMASLDLDRVQVKNVLWPGTHDSATNKIGIPLISRPFAQCQTLSIYNQLCLGVRVLDIRVQETGRVCHGILNTYKLGVVIEDIQRFLSETRYEFIILEIRTAHQRFDPPDLDKYLIAQFEDLLVPQDKNVFDSSLKELLPHRVICIWKPKDCPAPSPGSSLFSSGFLTDDWIDTDLPARKFDSNLQYLGRHEPNSVRKYFYRVENTATPQITSCITCVYPVTNRIRRFARLFVSQAHKQGLLDRLQIFSTDFVDENFVNICVGVTMARHHL